MIACDALAQAPLLALEDLDVRIRFAERLFEAEHIGRERNLRLPDRRLFVFARRIFGVASPGLGDFALERGDLGLLRDDVRVPVVVLGAERRQLLLQTHQAQLGRVGHGDSGRRQRGRGDGRGRQEGFRLGELTRQRLPPLGGPHLVVGVHPQLSVQPLEAREIVLHLLRQLAQVAPLEVADSMLQFVELLSRLGELHFEKVGRARRQPLADFQVLFDVKGRQGVRDERHGVGIAPLIADRERHGRLALASDLDALQLQLDVATHPLDDVFQRRPCSENGVEGEAVDQRLKSRATQDLLRDRLKARLQRARDGRLHEALRHLLAVHEHGGSRPVDVRQKGDEARAGRHGHGEHEDRQPLAPAPEGQQPLQTGSLRCLFGHVTVPARCRRFEGRSSLARRRRPCCS